MLTILQIILLIPIVGGSIFSLLTLWAARRFFTRPFSTQVGFTPPVTILKPIYGLDKGLEDNLRSFCVQDYPTLQIVFSVQRVDDPALPTLRKLAAEFPERVTLVIKPSEPVVNGKVQNLCNGLAEAKHDVLIISDSDARANPDYVRAIVTPLHDPSVGYVCSLYRSVHADHWWEKLELLSLNADFLPSVVFSTETGAALFCTGATLAFRRQDLEAVGGMADLGDYLVEDYELGRRLVKLRRRYVLIPYVIDLLADYGGFRQWWNHQVYWDQNTWAANPLGFALTIFTRAVPFALVLAALRGFDAAGLIVFALALIMRLGTARIFARDYLTDREGLRALWLLPLRDLIALASWYVALTRRSFVWRGHRFGLTRDGRIVPPGSHHMTRVLVTGGAGFIGSHTVDLLISRGHEVIVVDDLSTGFMANLARWQDHPQLTFVKADITNDIGGTLNQVAAVKGPIARIIHFAAQTAVPLSMDDPVGDIRVNVAGSVALLEYARRNKVEKVFFASSSAVYDDDAPVPVDETSRARPASPYGIDKLVVEIYLDYYARYFGLKYTALRFMNVYGPRQDPKSFYSGVISIFMDRAVNNTPITIFDDGEQTRDFVYVTDVAEAVVKSCLEDGAHGEIINIGTGLEVTVNEIARTILDLAKSRSVVTHAPPRPGDIRRSVTTMDKAERLLAFHPKVGLREGLETTLAWVREQSNP